MFLRPLLSLVKSTDKDKDKGLEWVASGMSPGLNSVQKSNFPGRLFKFNKLEPSSVPSFFSHPFVFKTKLSIGDAEAFQEFSDLVKGLFLGVIQVVEIRDKLGQIKRIAQKVKPGFHEFVIMKWKDLPIGGTYPDCLFYPGAKFEAGEYGQQASWDDLTLQIEEKEAQLGPSIVRALYQSWLDELRSLWTHRMKAIQGVPDGENLMRGTPEPLWLQRLEQLKYQWATRVQAPDGSLPEWTTGILNIHVQADPGHSVAIPLRTVAKNIFCEKIVKFKNGKMPDLPIKSEFLDLIDGAKRVGDGYQLRLRGWPGEIDWVPLDKNVLKTEKASILLWPNFKAPKWNVNYALFYPSPQFMTEHKPTVNLINFDGRQKNLLAELKEQPGIAAGCATEKEITHVEIFCQNIQAGIFEDGRFLIPAAAGERRLSLDFGTAHTCLGVWDGQENTVLSMKDMTTDILGMNFFDQTEFFQRSPVWLPTYAGECRVLPSELMFYTADMNFTNLSRFVTYLTIPFFSSSANIPYTVSGFKWHEPAQFSGHRGDLVKAYLKMILHMALATLRGNHNTRNINIIPTYPLAFDKQRYEDYKRWLMEIIQQLKDETGMAINFENTTIDNRRELVGESYAAIAPYGPPAGSSALVADIGGGTTDIAILKNDRIEILDSVKYGGEVFLKYWADNFRQATKKSEISFINDTPKDHLKLALQKALRIVGSISEILKEYDNKGRDDIETGLVRFYNGLFEYLRIILLAENLTKDIFLFPIGNGWRFIEGLRHVPNLTSFVQDWFSSRGIQLIVNLNQTKIGFKEDLAYGANEIVEQKRYNPHPDFVDKPVRSYTPPEVTVIWDQGSLNFQRHKTVPSAGLGFLFENRPRFDTISFIQSLPFQNIKHLTNDQIASRLNAECNKGMWGVTASGLSLIRSVYAKFLEEIYPEYYL